MCRRTSPTNTTNATNASSHSDIHCPFANCVPWRVLVIDASNMNSQPLTLANLGTMFPSLKRGPLKCTLVNSSKPHTTPVYVVRMSSEEQGKWGIRIRTPLEMWYVVYNVS